MQRSFEDEELLKIIGETSDVISNPEKYFGVLKIYDARPFWNAVGNAVAGKGYENNAVTIAAKLILRADVSKPDLLILIYTLLYY